MVNYWIVGAWNIRHALRNGAFGEWWIDIVHPVKKGDKAIVYVLKESEYNPSGKAAGCFIGDFTVASEPHTICGPWIWAEHTYQEDAEHQGFEIRDFKLWKFFVDKDEAHQYGADFDLGMLRAGRGMMQITREAYLKILDVYTKKVEEAA